jgi:serine/threonine-protein kinase RsbW
MSPVDRLTKEFDQRGPASVEEATRLRHRLVNWLRDLGTSADVVDTIGLAAYEAMANVVTHAYPPGTAGRMELSAGLDQDTITVTVTDHGRWKPWVAEREPVHGRGLLLIRRLADHAEVIPGDHGTTVLLSWPM